MQYQIQPKGQQAVLRLLGEVTAPDRSAFEAVASRVLEGGPKTVAVDLSELVYMDSAGLGFLLILLKMAEEKGASVVLAGPRGEVKEQLELARFNLLFPISESV